MLSEKCGAVRLGKTPADDKACSKELNHDDEHDFSVVKLSSGKWADE